MNNSILKIENLSVYFDSDKGFIKALDEVTFSLKKGEKLGILGESGAGKTVLLSAITGMLTGLPGIISGKIFFDNEALINNIDEYVKDELGRSNRIEIDIKRIEKLKKEIKGKVRGKIAYIFQDPRTSLDPMYKIKNHLFDAIKKSSNYGQNQNLYVEALLWLERVNIHNPNETLEKFPTELSGGMLQRIMIAIAMIMNPKLVFADEPTTALDVRNASVIINLLKTINQQNGTSLIFISHNLDNIAALADNIIVMTSGEIVEMGSKESVLSGKNAHPYTEVLLNSRLDPLKANKDTEIIFSKEKLSSISFDRGCKYRDRCSFAKSECESFNELIDVAEGDEKHFVRCIKYKV